MSDSRAYSSGSLGWRQRANFLSREAHVWVEGGTSSTVTETMSPPGGVNPGNVVGSVYDFSPNEGYIYTRAVKSAHRVDRENNTTDPRELLVF